MRPIYFFGFLAMFSTVLLAQEKPKWDVSNPPYPYTPVNFETNEGTWMNLDVSPDGRTIIFDMLGDIYSMPISGGAAKLLRGGIPFEVQPRFSPDGAFISFTSDADGADNIWVMKADGSAARQVTKERFRLLNNAVWMPDGQYLVARKHFSSTRSLGAGELWMYHISGGDGVQLTAKKNAQQDQGEPCASADGRYIYFSEDMYGGGFFQYNKDPNNQIFAVRRYDTQKGIIEDVVGGPGGAARPQISHDGKRVAFVRRVRTKTVLCMYDIETAQEVAVWDGLNKDQQEAWTIFGVYPNFAWLPGDKEIVIWAKGKLWRVVIGTNNQTEIPFNITVNQQVAETCQFKQQVDMPEATALVIRHATTSPDGKILIFNALGNLWKKDLPNGRPTRLTKSTDIEDEPSFSRDGQYLAYITFNDTTGGTIVVMDLKTNATQKISSAAAIYRTPNFSPDGSKIVFQREDGNEHQGFFNPMQAGIYTVSSKGGKPEKVNNDGFNPTYSLDGQRIMYEAGGGLSHLYKSCKPDGTDERTLCNSTYGKNFTPSPDNRWIAFSDLFKVYIAAMPTTGKTLEISADMGSVPVAQVARDEGRSIHWTADSKTLHWLLGETYFTDNLNERFKFVSGALDTLPPMDTVGIQIGLRYKVTKGEKTIAFTNATIITMEGNEVIKGGTLVVSGNKIVSIGTTPPAEDGREITTIDCTGKTIMPGIIDVHAHLGTFRNGISPQKQWSYWANLAYGVTTTHDPSTETEITFAQSEMVKAGVMVGPRIFSTGTILYGADGDFKAVINSLDDARSALRRTKAYGAFSVKSYNQPRREQRQQIIAAAKELNMNVVPEGGSFFFHNLTQVIDGHTGIEHNIPVAPLYNDVIKLWSATKAHNTPTLIVNYGGINGEYFWYERTNVWEKERMLRFMPRAVLDTRARHRTIIPDEEYQNGHILVSQTCKKMQDNGININLGAHGQIQGIGAHWELWMLVQGGMTNLQALRCATINGANYIGMGDEIGSLKVGKLADLIILDGNPLTNIQNTENVRYTMVNGTLYDAATMTNHFTKQGPSKFFWELDGAGNHYPFYEETHSCMHPNCVCHD